MIYKIIANWLENLNDEQIKHLAMAFRILGVGAFLSLIKDKTSSLDVVVLVACWGFLEYIGIMVLGILNKEEDK